MKQFFRYLYDCRYVWLWALLSGAVFSIVFALYGIPAGAVGYPLLMSAIFGLIFLVLGFLRYRKKHLGLNSLNPEEAPCAEYLPRADSLTERDYQTLVFREEAANRAGKEAWDSARKDMNDYYAAWVHQIKAPIAVIRVMLQQTDTQENRELAAELFRIEQYVEMALCYVRLGEGSSDLVIQEYDLDDIIRKAVRKFAGQFIRRKIRLVYSGTDMRVLTDEKWLLFIIEQLLSNAVKYTPDGGEIFIETKTLDDSIQVVISDTGKGMDDETLSHVFDPYFRGDSSHSSAGLGLGLAIVKRIVDLSGGKISVKSEKDTGTEFTITLPKRVNQK